MRIRAFGLGLLATLVALGAGCSNDGPADGVGGSGAAGSGGSEPDVGGSGGSGGSAGEGGSGGSVDLCGNGDLDDGEGCDDGNAVSGDGCASDCTWDGTCDAPLDFFEHAVEERGQFNVRGMLPNRDGLLEGSCGQFPHGSEMVYRYRAPAEGQLSFAVGSFDEETIVYTRRSCSDATSQLNCSVQGKPRLLSMKSGEELFLIVDGPSSGEDGTYVLSAEFIPRKGEGESCGPGHICQSGLDCINRTCVKILPADLHDATALRGGEEHTDLVILATAADRVGNVTAFRLRFLDAQGEAIDLGSNDPFWDPESRTLATAFDQRSQGQTQPGVSFRAWKTLPGLLGEHPEIVSVGVRVSNQGVPSEELIVGLEDQPVRSQGEDCGFPEPSDRCLGELLCWERGEGEGASCEDLADLRRAACLSAPVLEGSGSVAGEMERRSLWDPPAACWDPSVPERLRGNGLQESLVRLSLQTHTTRLKVSTDDPETSSMGTLVYLYSGCGESAPPLACDHTGGEILWGSTLVLNDVPAGDYLVVIDSGRPGGGSGRFRLEVEAE